MAKQNILWSVIPHGRIDGRWRVSIVVSPRLEPDSASEQQLGSFPEWLDWPRTVQGIGFALRIGASTVRLKPLAADPQLAPDSALWQHLFPETLFVSGYVFRDFSRVNLRSYPLRNVLGFVRRHYQSLSLQAGGGEHPRLLPRRKADPTLKGMLAELGTRTQKFPVGDRTMELPLPGFDRFHERPRQGDGPRPHEVAVNKAVFGPGSCFKGRVEWPKEPGHKTRDTSFPLRALPADWQDPARIRDGSIPVANAAERERRAQLMEQFSGPSEYAMWQADRFYQRTVPTTEQLAMRRPGFENMAPAPEPPQWDFHQRVASYGDHPQLLRRLGLVLDCVLEDDAPIDQALDAAIPATGLMQLQIESPGQHHLVGGDRFPRTAWLATKDRFLPRPRSEDHADGLLRLLHANDSHVPGDQDKEPSAFDVYQLDPDGAALKTVDFLLSAQRLVGKHWNWVPTARSPTPPATTSRWRRCAPVASVSPATAARHSSPRRPQPPRRTTTPSSSRPGRRPTWSSMPKTCCAATASTSMTPATGAGARCSSASAGIRPCPRRGRAHATCHCRRTRATSRAHPPAAPPPRPTTSTCTRRCSAGAAGA
ncbi:hypothetical protein H1235_10065 [Pseudoxanthomonas sp. NC8]|nr:hypothetical protein H1235_10065 [Pseudoxanthomonas sp. NC8]